MEYAIVVMAICLLALVWLAKRHSKGEQLHDLGGAFRHTPRLSGAILLVLAASIVCFTYEEFHPANGELIHYWIAAPFFTSVNFFGGLIFLVMGKQADKLLNMRPNEVPNSPLQSLTFWSITGITVVACLLFQWWVMTHYRRTF